MIKTIVDYLYKFVYGDKKPRNIYQLRNRISRGEYWNIDFKELRSRGIINDREYLSLRKANQINRSKICQ